MNLTEHFTREEYEKSKTAIRKGIKNTMPDALLPNARAVCQALELIRAHYNAPVILSSGYRCPALNTAVGGATHSDHLTGKAADFEVYGRTNREVYLAIRGGQIEGLTYKMVINEFPDASGEPAWVHLSVSPIAAENQARKLVAARDPATGRTVYTEVA